MGVSQFSYVCGDDATNTEKIVHQGRCVLTSVVVADTDGTYFGAGAVIGDGWATVLSIQAPVRGTAVWTGRIDLMYGLGVTVSTGGAVCPCTVTYE